MRYPLVEGLTGILWALIGGWSLGQSGTALSPLLPTMLIVVSAGVALVFIDLDCHRLPDSIVLPLWPVTLVGLVLAGIISGEWPIGRALAAAGLWLLVIGGIWLVTSGRGMGLGDVKLAPVLGVILGWVGWGPAVVGLACAWFIGGGVALVLLMATSGPSGRGSALRPLPFQRIPRWCAGRIDAYERLSERHRALGPRWWVMVIQARPSDTQGGVESRWHRRKGTP